MIERWLNKIICGDCLDVMREMPDKCIDLIVTDPPYGINIGGQKTIGGNKLAFCTEYGKHTWDKDRPPKEIFNEILRIANNSILWGGNYFTDILPQSNGWLVWNKEMSGGFADCELAWTSFDRPVRMFKFRWNGMLQENMKEKEKRVHPTQKPVALFEWILNRYSEPDDIILDPFLGSGTTIAACINTGRNNWIGVEKESDYCKLAEARIAKATEQMRLFI